MPQFLITIEAPNASDLAEELSQRFLVKKLAKEGFAVNSFEYHATIEFSSVLKEFAEVIDDDIGDWIAYKHSSIKKRKIKGMRQRQSLDTSEQLKEDLVCIELRRKFS